MVVYFLAVCETAGASKTLTLKWKEHIKTLFWEKLQRQSGSLSTVRREEVHQWRRRRRRDKADKERSPHPETFSGRSLTPPVSFFISHPSPSPMPLRLLPLFDLEVPPWPPSLCLTLITSIFCAAPFFFPSHHHHLHHRARIAAGEAGEDAEAGDISLIYTQHAKTIDMRGDSSSPTTPELKKWNSGATTISRF